MKTTANNVDTLAGSGASPQKSPTDSFVMLNEIDVGKISNIDQLKDFIYLCDVGLKFLDQEFAENLKDTEFRVFVNMSDDNFLAEGLKHHRSSTADKIKAAKRYRNRRQHILRKKQEASRNKVAKAVAKKMALSKKTPKGKPKRENNVSDSIDREGWLGRGTTFKEFMKPAGDQIMRELREAGAAWVQSQNKSHKLIVEYFNKKTGKIETVDAEIYAIRAVREINELL
jgi:hypothetical protein